MSYQKQTVDDFDRFGFDTKNSYATGTRFMQYCRFFSTICVRMRNFDEVVWELCACCPPKNCLRHLIANPTHTEGLYLHSFKGSHVSNQGVLEKELQSTVTDWLVEYN